MVNKHYEQTKRWREENRWFRPLEYARRRCRDKNHRKYPGYGGRGIRCTITANEAKEIYNRDRGETLKQPSLDRIDPDGHYTFGNCRYIELTHNVARRRPNGTLKECTPETEKDKEWEE